MASVEARFKIFQRDRVPKKARNAEQKMYDAQKNRGKPRFFRSFLFTLRERSRIMRMSVRRKIYFAEACKREESDKFRQVH